MEFNEMRIRNVPCYIPEFGETVCADMEIHAVFNSGASNVELSAIGECTKITLHRPMRGRPQNTFFTVQILGADMLVYAADGGSARPDILIEKGMHPYGYLLGLLLRG